MADNQQYWPLAPKQTSASDIRSVIANATKKSWAWMTIATKDELNQKKVSNTNWLSNKNIVNTTNTKVNPNIAAARYSHCGISKFSVVNFLVFDSFSSPTFVVIMTNIWWFV